MAILERRGVFWWHDEPVPDRLMAPDSHVAGLCRIEDDGRAVLELDGCLPSSHGPMAPIVFLPVTRCIQGLLKESDERILLSDLHRCGGRFASNGISFEKFAAMNCVIGQTIFPSSAQTPEFSTLEIPLDGFEAWLRLGSIKVSHTDGNISASYEAPNDLAYHYDDGSLSIAFEVDASSSGMFGAYALSLKQSALLRLCLSSARPLSDLRTQYGTIEDLLKLLTGSDYSLGWPRVLLADGSRNRWYFTRLKSKESTLAPEYHATVTNFLELRDRFGSIWSNWRAKREELGPGINLYLGTRRGVALYTEHRFVNLIWGLEAFHRKKIPVGKCEPLERKIERIIDQITRVKDKTWIKNKLKGAHEPPLKQRLFEVFAVLPIDLDKKRLRIFTDACATLRNDISHFGGQRHSKPYSDFIRDLDRKSNALSILYHALLLHEIGIEPSILKRWLYNSFSSLPIKANFVECGLLDQSALPDGFSVQSTGSNL